eukprot:236933_1
MAHPVDIIDEDRKYDDETADRLRIAFDFLSAIQVDCGPGLDMHNTKAHHNISAENSFTQPPVGSVSATPVPPLTPTHAAMRAAQSVARAAEGAASTEIAILKAFRTVDERAVLDPSLDPGRLRPADPDRRHPVHVRQFSVGRRVSAGESRRQEERRLAAQLRRGVADYEQRSQRVERILIIYCS